MATHETIHGVNLAAMPVEQHEEFAARLVRALADQPDVHSIGTDARADGRLEIEFAVEAASAEDGAFVAAAAMRAALKGMGVATPGLFLDGPADASS